MGKNPQNNLLLVRKQQALEVIIRKLKVACYYIYIYA